MENILLLFFLENIFLLIAVALLFYRRQKYWRDMKRFLFRIQPNPAFETIKSKELYLKQKVFIESPEIGVYLKRLYRTSRHMHTKVSSLLYITKGRAEVVMGKNKKIIRPGNFLYVPVNVYHDWKTVSPDKYVEYLEIANPSFAYTQAKDTVWYK